MPAQQKDASLFKIFLLVNLGMIVYTALQTLTKDMLTNRGVHIYEFVFFRSLFNMTASAIIIKRAKVPFFADIIPEVRGTLIFRCAVGTVSFLIFSMAVKYIPLGIFFIIFNSSPFFTVFLSYCWTGDRILVFEGIAMIGAFAGIVCLGLAEPEEASSDSIDQSAEESSMSEFETKYAY